MFDKKIYIKRREQLKKKIKTGLILFPGNDEAPMNYADNTYKYRQDSTFLYYFGLDRAGLFAIIDADENKEIIFGDDFTVNDIVWMGKQPTIKQLAANVGVANISSLSQLESFIKKAISQGRKIHYVPQYRYDNMLKLENLLGINANAVNNYASIELIKAVADQRSIKSNEELKEIEKAIEISYVMQTTAMQLARNGMVEREIAGFIEGIALSMGNGLSFPTIFSKHGETLHNHSYNNILKNGDIVVNDSGVESFNHYSSDITRTFPVSGKFTQKQKEIYQIVLDAQLAAIKTAKPKITWRSVHLKSALVIAEGLKALGLMKGDMRTAVNEGAHALFYPHGLGHLLGLDVHDMENFGEQYTGYSTKILRSEQFGLKSLRYGKELMPGVVLTVEPGIYFIPELIHQWEAEKKFVKYINYNKVKNYIGFGGIRIEDDIVITSKGCRVLGVPIPKSIDGVEAMSSEKI
ncbi:aminopeptidase P family protein [Melioribacteraceae bacterium 4301-Me]|uniref:aminopeptidase P family protein n=1 Tax=Pyranulibacter aquaticus TaxID=3163344 RepID=UPI0035950BB7